MAIREHTLTRHNPVVARDTTLEEVSCKVNEYFVSDSTFNRFVDGSNKDIISIFHNKLYGMPFSALMK